MYPQYMSILLYVKLIWCNGIPQIYCHLEWRGRCILRICAFSYMCNLFGVMVLHRSIVNLCVGQMYPKYMGILLYMKLIWCNHTPQVYCQLETGGQMCSQYMSIVLYVKLIWCKGIPQISCQLEWGVDVFSVYVHSAICESYLV